jgi:hypothetical protein
MLNKVLFDCIQSEISGTDYTCSNEDRLLLDEMIHELNMIAGTSYSYLAELDSCSIPDADKVVSSYIERFSSESVRAYLLPHIAIERNAASACMILRMYNHFRESEEYIATSQHSVPAHIYVRYDNAFRKIHSKRIKNEWLELSKSARDAFYLPLTMRMLAAWKLPGLYEILVGYALGDDLDAKAFGLNTEGESYPTVEFMTRELRFTAIDCLRHYPSQSTVDIIQRYIDGPDADIVMASKKTLKALMK